MITSPAVNVKEKDSDRGRLNLVGAALNRADREWMIVFYILSKKVEINNVDFGLRRETPNMQAPSSERNAIDRKTKNRYNPP